MDKPAPGKYTAIVSNNRFSDQRAFNNSLYDIIYIRCIKKRAAGNGNSWWRINMGDFYGNKLFRGR